MNIEIEYANDYLESMGNWGNAPFRPGLSYSERKLSPYHFTNAQKIFHNLRSLGRRDRPEWVHNLNIIKNSIEHYSCAHIIRIIVHKISMQGNELILHLGIAMIDDTQFQCGYVLSESLNLHANSYSHNFDNEDSVGEEYDNSSEDNSSLNLSSISFELPKKPSSDDQEEYFEIEDLTSVDEFPLSGNSDEEGKVASIMSANDELENINAQHNKENIETMIGSPEKKFKRLANWQPDIFRPLAPLPLLPELNKANAKPDSFPLRPPSL